MTQSPFQVTAHGGRSHFFVGGFIPRAMAIAAQNAGKKVVIRIAGGMSNDASIIFPYFRSALVNADGAVIMSGGTRCFDGEGNIQASVAEVVADLAAFLKNMIGMGSFPRTARFGFTGDGHFMVGKDNDVTVNVCTDYVVSIQNSPEDIAESDQDWGGDVNAYIEFMTSLRDNSGFKTAVIVYNGGGVTVAEAKKAYAAGIPVIVVTGSGRAADNQLAPTNFSGENIYHVDIKDPLALKALLMVLCNL